VPKSKGKEAPKSFLRECRAYSEKSTLIPPKSKGEEAPKSFLRECRAEVYLFLKENNGYEYDFGYVFGHASAHHITS
jgi:hypothetical protein